MKLIVFRLCIVCTLLCGNAGAQAWQTDGNVKYRLLNTRYPSNSIFHDFVGSDATDHSLSARLNIELDAGQWSANASYQLSGLYSDSLEYSRDAANGLLFQSAIQNDDARFLDLTHMSGDDGKQALVGRLDRLNVAYQSDSNVIKLGRQAVSWGNGLIYTPMDFFNPFDPTTIDTEYKTGDDMLYAQHLFKNGNDLQLAWVFRRDENQGTTSDVNSVALKYHGFVGSSEYDFLIAEHYQDTILGIGGSLSIGGSVVRGDWVLADTGADRFNNVVVNVSYSWTTGGKNVTGSLEYFHNDFGIRGDLSVPEIGFNPELLNRITRGELFTLGRDYLGGSMVVEMAPLWLLTPNVFYNLSDDSALAQLVSQHDLTQNTQLVVALTAPIGSEGTEYGGFSLTNNAGQEDKLNNNDWSIYAQLAWYF